AGPSRPSATSRGGIVPHRRRSPKLEERLRPADVGLGQLFVHTRDAIVVADVGTGRIALWNPAAERLFGWSSDEIVGQLVEVLIPPSIVRLHEAGLSWYRRGGRGALIDSAKTLDLTALNKVGDEIPVELSMAALDPIANGPAAGAQYVMGMVRDASDRRRPGGHMFEIGRAAAARTAIEQKLQTQQRLVEDGAADLQRQLNALQRSTRRLEGRASSTRAALVAAVVRARTARVKRLLDEVTACLAIEAGNLTFAQERVNLVPLVSRVVSAIRAAKTPCKINVALPQGLTVLADQDRLEDVVRVLLERAMRRNPRGCWIDVELRRPLAGMARLEVRDVGRPVSERLRRQLLAGNAVDRGMRLSRYTVAQHGGTLDVEFPADGGVQVVVTLPTQGGRVRQDGQPASARV
ncbi:MAG TPA: PAS domain S-box protein, partial [Chloroflexota bacterium]|nr:PAS domain S-box protein [Chloroflexota bacterium]